ncbi:MAG: class I SAM-dependent RNA methyltransferase [Actinomycetes bacterium]
MSDRPDVPPPPSPSAVGASLTLVVGPVAHGGHCIARHEGRVVFVRHALPGERVRAVVTEGRDRSSYWRADAVEVLEASPDRVTPPCPWAGPGRCGGCDLQHVRLDAQRSLKAAVVREQLSRLAGIDAEVTVEEVAGAPDGLGWRTRVHWAVDDSGRAGLRRHRSHEVVPVDRCHIAHRLVDDAGVTRRSWPGLSSVEVAASVATDEVLVLPDGVGAGAVTEVAGNRSFRVTGGGFWQVHPGAAAALLSAVLDGLEPRPGESALDLYCGVGLFAAALSERVGAGGRVTAVESDRHAVADARHNLADLPNVRLEKGRVDPVLRRLRLRRADLVVLDPPRSGAGRSVVSLLSRVQARRIAYVACDPAALARDVSWFAEQGYALTALRSFDLFPMTHHVECVAVLEPSGAAGGVSGRSSSPA